MGIIPGNAQHIGSRKEQQDDFGFSDKDDVTFVNHGGVLAVLTDGMGGLDQGREASLVAKQMMLKEYEEKSIQKTIPQALIKSLFVANAKVVEMARKAGLEGQTGTTLTAAVIKDDKLYWVSVGDSRIYLYRKGKVVKLTTDHDYGRQLDEEVALGQISEAEAAAHPQRQALTSYLGLAFLSEIDQNEEPLILEAGDRVLLCSDGLYKTISEDEIAKCLDRHPQDAAEGLIKATLARSRINQDNVTVAILAYEPGMLSAPFSWSLRFIQTRNSLIIFILLTMLCMCAVGYLLDYNLNSFRTYIGNVARGENYLNRPDFQVQPMLVDPSDAKKEGNDTSQELSEPGDHLKGKDKKNRKKRN